MQLNNENDVLAEEKSSFERHIECLKETQERIRRRYIKNVERCHPTREQNRKCEDLQPERAPLCTTHPTLHMSSQRSKYWQSYERSLIEIEQDAQAGQDGQVAHAKH